MRQERRLTLHPRDCFARVPRQPHIAAQGALEHRAQPRRQEQDAGADTVVGHCCRGAPQPELPGRRLP